MLRNFALTALTAVAFVALVPSCEGNGGDEDGKEEPFTRGLGQACVRDGDQCKVGLYCGGWNDCGIGFCMRECNDNSDCPAIDGVYSSCGPYDSLGPDVCRFSCDDQDSPCPTSFAQDTTCKSSEVLHCEPPPSVCEAR
ncbi:hypothetical protein OV203_44905 [Nannocystis sp. ILAH1]|uniref:hypothetical protein n=1 Tax=Nannocystis sp. ILAH1 TaxID=2996789 RepID=UPI002270AEFD|nr:hypothetical protein [Nannocystis sp. ILAH1]MCY0994349.1 hypothetical protein [Nannocystis sp. ILAH1]